MPTSVNQIFVDILGREPDGKIKWKDIIKSDIPQRNGIYIIALEDAICSIESSDIAIKDWMSLATNILINGQSPSAYDIKERLDEFWYPDEIILYIGKTSGATQNLKIRLSQFYRHILGKKSPHRGGHWIKTLSCLNELNVYWGIVEDEDPYEIEQQMIEYFLQRVSEDSRDSLYDRELPIPFANLEFWNIRKRHGFRNQTV